jgi:hypothetical protein
MSTSRPIGRIVKSNTHVDYVCRVLGPAEVASAPAPEDYAFGTFVRVGLAAHDSYLVGLIYDTILMDPEFGHLGPVLPVLAGPGRPAEGLRLSPPADLEIFSPDYLNERAVLVTIVTVGQVTTGGNVRQNVPLLAATLGAMVEKMSDDEVRSFHRANGELLLAYAPRLLAAGEPLIPHLLLRVTDQLIGLFPEQARQLAVLRSHLAWKTAIVPAG